MLTDETIAITSFQFQTISFYRSSVCMFRKGQSDRPYINYVAQKSREHYMQDNELNNPRFYFSNPHRRVFSVLVNSTIQRINL